MLCSNLISWVTCFAQRFPGMGPAFLDIPQVNGGFSSTVDTLASIFTLNTDIIMVLEIAMLSISVDQCDHRCKLH